jgi:mannitol/fructose-specific phosphotransferase system IIA component (Ntr-type)
MNISRYLKPDCIRLGLAEGHLDQADPEKDSARERERLKAAVIGELCGIFDASGEIRNLSKFERDFLDAEKAGSSVLRPGVALPCIRSLQPRKTVVIFARTGDGVWFDPPGKEPTHIILGLAAPSYEDRALARLQKWIRNAFLTEEWLPRALLDAEDEHEVIRILGHLQG